MAAYAPLTLIYPGDPTIRGLAKLPTMFSSEDVSQGAASDTNASSGLSQAQQTFNAFRFGENTGSSSGATSDSGNIVNEFLDGYHLLTGSSGDPTGANADANATTDCSNVSFLTHPLDATSCLLDRTLFGLLALVVIGFGLYVFTRD